MTDDVNLTIFINPAGNAGGEYLVELRAGEKSLAQVQTRIDLQALLAHEHAYSAHDYGMELYDAVFTGKVGREYQRLVGRAGATTTIRVQLVISEFARELHALPWERLFHIFAEDDTALTTSAQTPFSRFLVTGAADQPPVQDQPLRLLVAIANPAHLPAELAPIDVIAEVRALAQLFGGLQKRVIGTLLPGHTALPQELRQELAQAGWTIADADAVTNWDTIQRYLPGQHMLHILAHGQFKPGDATAYLLLEHAGDARVGRGGVQRVSDQTIVAGLAGVRPLPQLVFLAACASAKRSEQSVNPFVGLGPKLVEAGAPAVVAMQDLVSMDLAHTLTGDFYRRLFAHGQVDRALNEARSLLFKRDAFAWAIPVLFLRLQGGRLFADQQLEPLERVIFAGLIAEHTRLFAGREVDLATLEQFMATPGGGYLLVQAGAGLGKTALMANLIARSQNAVAYHLFTPRIPESLQEAVFLRNLLEQISPWYGLPLPTTRQPEELRKRYDALLGQAPQGLRTVILDGLDEVIGWDLARYLTRNLPPSLHFILTVRATVPDPVLTFALPPEQVQPMQLQGLTRAGVQAVLQAAGGAAPQFAEDDDLLDQLLRVTLYDEAQPALGADTLFVRLLAEDAASGRLQPHRLAGMPAQMEAYLDRWWQALRVEFGEEGDRRKRQQAMVDLAGTLAAALGPIGRADLEAINSSLVSEIEQDFVATVVRAVQQIVVRDAYGDYTLLHPRLRHYLRQKLKTSRYRQRLLKHCAQWPKHHSRYALRYYAAHLAEAATLAAEPERHIHTETLVKLTTDRQFQDAYLQVVQDLPGLQADLQRGLELAAGSAAPEALPLLVASALAFVRFRRERLRPEPIFALAAQGDIAGARRMLDLFEMDTGWYQVALLEIAWLAGSTGSAEVRRQAATLRAEVAATQAEWPADDQRLMLLQWIAADLEQTQKPTWHDQLPPARNPQEVRTMLALAAGVSPEADLSPEMLMPMSGLNWELLVAGGETVNTSGAMNEEMFFAYYIGPLIVALTLADPPVGDQELTDYLAVHTAYVYANYRFGSLWALLRPILKHTEPDWIRTAVRDVLNSALGGGSNEFTEGVPLTISALAAIGGNATAAKALARHAAHFRAEAGQFSIGRGRGDTWGHYKRRLATFAQAEAVIGVAVGAPAHILLHEALGIHYGYAGYHAPACLTLAEAMQICRPPEASDWIEWSLASAQRAAHNIQEGTFCARTTARVNAMRSRWWPQPALHVRDAITTLRAIPRAEYVASLHYVGHAYPDRGGPLGSFPLPNRVLQANTLSSLAGAYQRGLPEFQRLNRAWQPDHIIPYGTAINVPDPGLTPLLAARLAAEALSAPDLSVGERVALIRSLVPLTAVNPTALDTVLARLLLAERPTDPAILRRLVALAPLPKILPQDHA